MPDPSPNLKPVLDFLDELHRNNNKPWFDEHRPAYQAARLAFEQFVDGLIDEFRVSDDLDGLSARNCIARIYRDIRFSRDKSPYKPNLGAMIAPGGWKPSRPGYYVSLEPPGNSIVAGGLYDPSPEQLEHFRQAMVRNASAFKKITHAPAFVEIFGEVSGERLKTAPKGYDREHPEIALLQLKQVFAQHPFTDREVLSPAFPGQVVNACRAMRPFLDYLDEITA